MGFRFKQFSIDDSGCAMKVGTDGVLIGAWCEPLVDVSPLTVLDVGAGCGLVALMMAQRFDGAKIDAIEIDRNAFECACVNIENSPWRSRIDAFWGDFITYPFAASGYDLIVSNPPFFNESLRSPDSRRAAARHGETLGIKGLICRGASLLTDVGTLCFIAPANRHEEVVLEAELARLSIRRITSVKSKSAGAVKRCLYALSRCSGGCVTDDLTIGGDGRQYSPEFEQLTSEFYL